MVSKTDVKGQTAYECELCGMRYWELDIAEQCEDYCGIHGSCSIEITRKAIHRPSVQFMR